MLLKPFSHFYYFSSSMMSEISILFSIDDKCQLCLICSFLLYHLIKILLIENFWYIHKSLWANSADSRSRSTWVSRSDQLLGKQIIFSFIHWRNGIMYSRKNSSLKDMWCPSWMYRWIFPSSFIFFRPRRSSSYKLVSSISTTGLLVPSR